MQGKLSKKNSCTASIPGKNVLAYAKNCIPARVLLTKNLCSSKIPPRPPPASKGKISYGPSLSLG